jgi:hypothetical protein
MRSYRRVCLRCIGDVKFLLGQQKCEGGRFGRRKGMNIYNLVSTAFVAAGLDESDFLVRIQKDTTLYVSIYKKNTHKKILLYIGIEDDNYVSDFVVWEENLSPVIGLDAYERFTQRIQNETYISV